MRISLGKTESCQKNHVPASRGMTYPWAAGHHAGLSYAEISGDSEMDSEQRRISHIVTTGLVACMLAACSTPQERAARKQAEVEQMMATYGPACQRLGYTPDSDPWRSCVLQLNAQDDLRYRTSPGYYCNGWGPGYWRGGCW
jgi:hypothetical protein